MLPSYGVLKNLLKQVIMDKTQQGHVTDDLFEQLKDIGNSYDEINSFAIKLSKLPYREDWKYVEPSGLQDILAECAPERPIGKQGNINLQDISGRIRIAFLSSVCGCILGKPLEEFPCPTLYEIKDALQKVNSWPLDDYIPENMLDHFGRRHRSWYETVKERISYVASDDDITYKLIAMMNLEQNGTRFSQEDIKKLWIDHLPIYTTWGPERNVLLKIGLASLSPEVPQDIEAWGDVLNPGEEQCGAMIRVDTYGYACPGRPDLAAELAFRDASMTHRKTGIYASMFVAAAIALAPVTQGRMEIFRKALMYVPQRSRFHEIVEDSIRQIETAESFEEGYDRIHNKYMEYGACRILQEIGTLMNSVKFASDIASGICLQVVQGNDTDSFGAIAGSLLGAYFGKDYFDDRWIRIFNDEIFTTMGDFNERSLSALADRMGKLPQLINL